MTVCLSYSRPDSGSTQSEIFGLDVAINNMVGAWLTYSNQQRFVCRPTDIPSYDHFKGMAQSAGHDPEQKCVGLDPRHPRDTLEPITCMFQPDPNIADLSWSRRQLRGPGYAVCGVVHTMSGERIIRTVGELAIAPTSGNDALICPSRAIRDAVQNLWDIQNEYLNNRFRSRFNFTMQLPVIPLGIHTNKFAKMTTPAHRHMQRQALGVAEDEIVVLFLGRMSFATKAHPVSMFMAAEQAAKASGKKIRLVMAGYYKPAGMETFFRMLGGDICKTAKLDFVMNNDPRFPEGLWAGADMFISLVENIQESFGLTPIEAMASGLPAIVSDWDGYRDGVRHGVDGFQIPTIAPPPPTGLAIADRYFNHLDNYGEQLCAAAQSTAVDIRAASEAIRALAEKPDMRAAFGTSARAHAQNVYDWKHIITQYEALWAEMGRQHRAAPPANIFPDRWQAAHLAYPNPWQMFSSFPAATLGQNTKLALDSSAEHVDLILRHEMNFFVPDLLLPREELVRLAENFAEGKCIGDVLAHYESAQRDAVWRSCGWLLKMGICRQVA